MTRFSPILADYRPIGPTGTVLTADSTRPGGVRWDWPFRSPFSSAASPLDGNAFSVLIGTGIINPEINILGTNNISGIRFTWAPTGIYDAPVLETMYVSGFTSTIGTVNGTTTIVMNMSGLIGNYTADTIIFTAQQYYYYGVSTGTLSYDNVFIRNLTNGGLHPLALSVGPFTGTLSSGQYFFFGCRTSQAPILRFTDSTNNIKGGFTLISSGISFTNDAGFTENYQLWRTDYDALGPFTFTVTTA